MAIKRDGMTLARIQAMMKTYRKGFEMTKSTLDFGFNYFTSPEYYVKKAIHAWLPVLRGLGASVIVFESSFDRAIPEDVFLCACEHHLKPVVHFTSELPLARKLNEVAFLMEVYAKWGVREVIFGKKPNMKQSWPIAGWHYESLVDHFLDRFIPLATQAVRIGLVPIAPPLQPGGDYWDTAFLELFLSGLKRRQVLGVLQDLTLASYGYTFGKPLDWGRGGPEQWTFSKPYQQSDEEQDQLGFHQFEWMQAISQRVTGKTMETVILDAGSSGFQSSSAKPEKTIEAIREILHICQGGDQENQADSGGDFLFTDSTRFCAFGLETLADATDGSFNPDDLVRLLGENKGAKSDPLTEPILTKPIKHYLLLPWHKSGLSDAILNKVRPIIKTCQPTIGFSLEEAALAEKVSIYPDQGAFPAEAINQLRNSGSIVKILPESGIDIATSLNDIRS